MPEDLKKETQDHAVRIAVLENVVQGIKDELHSINANINKLVWVAVTSIAGSVIQFILSGGLHK